MARTRLRIDPKRSHKGAHGSVTITGDTLEVELDEAAIATELAEASARSIAEQLRAAPGDRWYKTGTLATGLRVARGADGKSAGVVAPADRLQRDPRLLEKLATEIAAVGDPASDRRVEAATEQAAAGIVKVRR